MGGFLLVFSVVLCALRGEICGITTRHLQEFSLEQKSAAAAGRASAPR
jgi:hypothetical protein